MRKKIKIAAYALALILVGTGAEAAPKTVHRRTTSTLVFGLWVQRSDIAPRLYTLTNWYVEINKSGGRIDSQLFFERILCEENTGQAPCVTLEQRTGTSRPQGRRFRVPADLKRASLDAVFDLQTILPPGVPVGPPVATRIVASWTAIDAPERAHGVTSYDGRCAYRQTVSETGFRSRAAATIDGASIGRTTEARIVRSIVDEERAIC